MVERAPAIGLVARGDGDEVGRADRAQPRELRSDRGLVADDGDVGGTVGTLGVEHRAVDGEVAVARELLARGGATVGLVVGDDRGQRDDDTRFGPSGFFARRRGRAAPPDARASPDRCTT